MTKTSHVISEESILDFHNSRIGRRKKTKIKFKTKSLKNYIILSTYCKNSYFLNSSSWRKNFKAACNFSFWNKTTVFQLYNIVIDESVKIIINKYVIKCKKYSRNKRKIEKKF